MPERLWTDGDYPVGMTGECSEIATAFLVAVEGPSMIPRYNPGEFALVEPGTTPDIEDDVLVRLATGQTILKRLLSMKSRMALWQLQRSSCFGLRSARSDMGVLRRPSSATQEN